MTLDPRSRFTAAVAGRGYAALPELPLHAGQDTYFVVSPVAGYVHLFHPSAILSARNAALTQRTLTCDRIDLAGTSPLANPSEPVSGYFRFGDRHLDEVVHEPLSLLQHLSGFPPERWLVRTTDRLPFRAPLESFGIPGTQIFDRTGTKPLNLGPGRPPGEYLFIYATYRHGIVPVAAVGVVPYGGRYATDASVFTERLAFIASGHRSPAEGQAFTHLSAALTGDAALSALPPPELHLWTYLTRAVLFCLRDGLRPSHAYAGHYVKRMLRLMAHAAVHLPPNPAAYRALADASFQDLDAAGYPTPFGERADIGATFAAQLTQHHRQLNAALKRVVSAGRRQALTTADAERLRGDLGLRRPWIAAHLERQGLSHTIEPTPVQTILGYAGYPHDDRQPVNLAQLFSPA